MKNKFNIASIDIDCKAESHRILNFYTRYMLKKFDFPKYDHSLFKTCPRYENYYSHVNEILINAKKNLFNGKNNLTYSPSKCIEIDLIVQRFLLRKYKINLKYNSKVKRKINTGYHSFKLSFKNFIKDIIFDLRERGGNHQTKQEFYRKINSQNNVLIISHDSRSYFDAYKNLPNKLSIFFNKKNLNTYIILPADIGISVIEKIRNFNYILKKLFKLSLTNTLKLSDYHFIITELYNYLYKNKLKKIFIRKKFIAVICSYIDSRYLPIYFEAAKELNIKFYNYDYSLGYPIKETKNLRYLPDTRKFCDVIFSNSIFRTEQYKISSNFLDNPPKILSHSCPQSDYSLNKGKIDNSKSSILKIGLVDNAFNDYYSINSEDINSIINLLIKTNYKIQFILQSKRGYLDKTLINLNVNNFQSGTKGDFSLLERSDILVSIGWQSIALKAASLYKKPLIFYNKNDFPYEENIFSLDKNKNLIIKNYCKKLWFCKNNFLDKFNNLFNDKKEFEILQKQSLNLISEIGFYHNKIEDYFDDYFKDLFLSDLK